MMKYTISDIASVLDVEEPRHPEYTVDTLLTDSRALTYPKKTLFFALSTPNNDGHKFIPELYGKGVGNFVVTHLEDSFPDDANYLITDDVSHALQALAAHHRSR